MNNSAVETLSGNRFVGGPVGDSVAFLVKNNGDQSPILEGYIESKQKGMRIDGSARLGDLTIINGSNAFAVGIAIGNFSILHTSVPTVNISPNSVINITDFAVGLSAINSSLDLFGIDTLHIVDTGMGIELINSSLRNAEYGELGSTLKIEDSTVNINMRDVNGSTKPLNITDFFLLNNTVGINITNTNNITVFNNYFENNTININDTSGLNHFGVTPFITSRFENIYYTDNDTADANVYLAGNFYSGLDVVDITGDGVADIVN